MEPKKLTNMLKIISEKLSEKKIPFCLIGAMALGLYGLPRYTSDIDILTVDGKWPEILSTMENLGYTCFQKTESFAQLDSELGIFGNVDFMFVKTQAGKEIISNSTFVKDTFFTGIPIVQPTDYIILKLMAIANNPDRSLKDESDISSFFNLYNKDLVPDDFAPIDRVKIIEYANKFGQISIVDKYINQQESHDKKQNQL